MPNPQNSFLETRKAERRERRLVRKAYAASLSPEERFQLQHQMANHVITFLKNSGHAGVVASYAETPDEISPAFLEQALVSDGWQTAFPKVTDGPLNFHLCQRSELVPGYKSIPEPPPQMPLIRPTIILVPLVAADLSGNRMGQGGGHYDRTLESLRKDAASPVLTIGLAWDMQVAEHIESQAWDQSLDALATPSGFHLFNSQVKPDP